MYTGLQVKLFLSYFNKAWIFSTDFHIPNLMENLPVGAELSHAGGRTDGQTDMTKLISSFRNFANAPTNDVDSCKQNWLTLQIFLKSTQREGVKFFLDCILKIKLCTSAEVDL